MPCDGSRATKWDRSEQRNVFESFFALLRPPTLLIRVRIPTIRCSFTCLAHRRRVSGFHSQRHFSFFTRNSHSAPRTSQTKPACSRHHSVFFLSPLDMCCMITSETSLDSAGSHTKALRRIFFFLPKPSVACRHTWL